MTKHYVKKYLLFFSVVVFMGMPDSLASTYMNEEAAMEGLQRGSDPFARSTGIFNCNVNTSVGEEGQVRFNGILIHPSLVLTSRHCVRKEVHITAGSFWLASEPEEAWHKIASGKASQEYLESWQQVACGFDPQNIYFPPDEETDLAIVVLKRPLKKIAPLPLLLEKPQKWANGYFVSYAPVSALQNLDKILGKNKRHIAILDIAEKPQQKVLFDIQKKSDLSPSILMSKWRLEGDPLDPLNRKFIPEEGMHRLKALSQQSDSGASFIVKYQKVDHIAGIHRGRGVITNDSEEPTGEVTSLITPLYPHKEWILKVLSAYSS